MNGKHLKFNNIILNKKKFHKSKEPIDLFSVDFKYFIGYLEGEVDEGFKYFIGYLEDEIVKSLCIILRQMDGYIK